MHYVMVSHLKNSSHNVSFELQIDLYIIIHPIFTDVAIFCKPQESSPKSEVHSNCNSEHYVNKSIPDFVHIW